MTERLALIAGSGALVPEVIAAARSRGFALKLLTVGKRHDLRDLEPVRINPFRLQEAVDVIRDFGATRFALAGGVSLSDVVREGVAGFLTGTANWQSLGDTSISDLVTRLEDMTGAKPMGVHEIAPHLVAPEGLIGGKEPNPAQYDAARYALGLAREAGRLDLGQAVVVSGRRAVAAEDVGGTDALLRRVRWLRWRRLVADGTSPLVLAKCPKPEQPLFVDLPAMGPRTVQMAAKAGIAVIAVQAGGALLIQRELVKAQADRLGVSVIGLSHD